MSTNSIQPIISGTFLDGIPADIPSQNWGRTEWARQFDVFAEMKLDTVVVIRTGWRDMCLFNSKVVKPAIFTPDDLLSVFFSEAERTGIKLFLGGHDSYDGYVSSLNWNEEAKLNIDLIDELVERYGHFSSFAGWYLSHEPDLDARPWLIWNPLIEKMRSVMPNRPILLSPRYEGKKWNSERPKSPAFYADQFDDVLSRVEGKVDYAAFMDGHVAIHELGFYIQAMSKVLEAHGIEFWSNLECFDRDMPLRFPPIDWQKMRVKLEAAAPHVSKIITFEAAHFCSPLSMWDSGRMLYKRYMEFAQNKL